MKVKPVTPYQRMLEHFREVGRKVRFPKHIQMWVYPKEKLEWRWSLTDLWERTQAAQQLGWVVELVADDKGLRVEYVQRVSESDLPWEAR